jgi:hypothetical protein
MKSTVPISTDAPLATNVAVCRRRPQGTGHTGKKQPVTEYAVWITAHRSAMTRDRVAEW